MADMASDIASDSKHNYFLYLSKLNRFAIEILLDDQQPNSVD